MIGMAPCSSEFYAEMILASGDVVLRVLMVAFQRILDENGMPADMATSVAFTIFNVNDIS